MLGTKDILLGAHTCSPALNEFAKLVATKLPTDVKQIDCQDLAHIIMEHAREAQKHHEKYRTSHPQLYKFLDKGGNMCALSAKITEIIDAGATTSYAKDYREISRIYFGA